MQPVVWQACRGVTGIFFWGGKVIFPDFFPGVKSFFPVENSHFGRPKTNFRRFQKWKAKKKKKKKKKGPHLFFWRFPASVSNFPPFSLFSLPLFSRYVSTLPPCPPACYATAGMGWRADAFHWKIFVVQPGKKEGRKKREYGEEKKEHLKCKGKSMILSRGPFFFFFLLFHFKLKPLKFVLGLPKWKFLLGKSISRREKNKEKWLCPLWKIFLFRHCMQRLVNLQTNLHVYNLCIKNKRVLCLLLTNYCLWLHRYVLDYCFYSDLCTHTNLNMVIKLNDA